MLSKQGQKLIRNYLSLPFPGISDVRCPYFNNARLKQRGQLRALIGKGTPQEIVEETEIYAKQYGINLKELTTEEIKRFLVEKNLGIECSGFVVHVLRAHFLETKKIDITKKMFIPANGLFRKLVIKIRKVENANVKILANDANSEIVPSWKNTQAGDMIILKDTDKHRDHIILITDFANGIIKYAHARAWSQEGKYGHGVNTGEIVITKPEDENILNQKWKESPLVKKDDLFHQEIPNETFLEAKQAKTLEIRRIKT